MESGHQQLTQKDSGYLKYLPIYEQKVAELRVDQDAETAFLG